MGHHDESRSRLMAAFIRSGDPGKIKRAERLSSCCRNPILFVAKNGKVGLALQRCRDRLCPMCSRLKSLQMRARVESCVKQMRSIRFVTLTIENKERSLTQCVDHLVASFRELRRGEVWKKHVVGGVWVIEVKQGRKEGTWHAHLHMLVDGVFFTQSTLADEWNRVTGDSQIVHIRKVHTTEGVANYVTKYVSKPCDFNAMSDEEIAIYAESMKGRRMMGTIGKLHAAKIEEEIVNVVDANAGVWISARKLLQLAADGNALARGTIDLCSRLGGLLSRAVCGDWRSDGSINRVDVAREIARNVVALAAEVDAEREASISQDKVISAMTAEIRQRHRQLEIEHWLEVRQV